MKMKFDWMDQPLLRAIEGEGTDAHRLCTANDGWVERFGRDVLISSKTTAVRDQLILELYLWCTAARFKFDRIFARYLPKKNEERAAPRLLFGDPAENLHTIANEGFLKYGIDFGAGYSVGLFLDQRENRRHVRAVGPKRLLNCFAYTCSFSVVAAYVGATTVSVDLSKKWLMRGRENFALNSLPTNGHRFIVDDVRPVLRRLARRGEKFDMIILDPPTFSRARHGKAFHIETDFEGLLLNALALAERDARILLSSNCASMRERVLDVMARGCLRKIGRAGELHRQPRPADFPPGSGASSVWLTLR
jgi:23S rRNA (cytosine1962-C5)-methyltransferase